MITPLCFACVLVKMNASNVKFHTGFTFFKFKDILHQKMTETSATAHIGGVNIVLLEGITPNIQ